MPAPSSSPDQDPWLDRPAWAPAWLPDVDDVRDMRWLRWFVTAVFAAGLGACVVRGADSPPDPVVLDTTSVPADGDETGEDTTTTEPVSDDVRGLAATFGTVIAELIDTAGEIHVLCLLHADTGDERSQGLMGVTDLSGVDGMLFSRAEPSTSGFYMYRTLIPLTVGWWAGEGTYVGQADMEPCESDDPTGCPTYPPPGPYVFGIEVAMGDPLAGRFAGSTLTVGTASCAPGSA